MRHGSRGRSFQLGAGLSVLLIIGACSDTGPTSSVDEALLNAAFAHTGADSQIGTPTVADAELFEVCKRWVGTPATANFEISDATHTHAFTDAAFLGPYSAMGFNDWWCADVWLEGPVNTVTVMETGVTGGTNPYTTTVTAVGFNNTPVVAGTSVTGIVQGSGGPKGVTAFYTNTEEIPPGDEGCTPGYWKQSQHFGNWVTYGQGDSYDRVFGVTSSFGGTLLEALWRGGGKENALGRHATAALLNATGDVNAFYDAATVISLVQRAYASGNFNAVKNLLAAANELGCPLGRNP